MQCTASTPIRTHPITSRIFFHCEGERGGGERERERERERGGGGEVRLWTECEEADQREGRGLQVRQMELSRV